MAQPSTQDILKAFDPTGYGTITGAGLGQLVDGANAGPDTGMPIKTVDVAGVPEVPNANTNIKWKRYLWVRQLASSVSVYAWNENAASHATFLKWEPVTIASIPDLSITNDMIANGAVNDRTISDVAWNKITGVPSGFAPTGAAGGDLTGTYPNPTVALNAITAAKLQSDAAVDANRAVGANHIKNNVIDPTRHFSLSAALKIIRMNVGATAWEVVSKVITELAEPAGAADAFKLPRLTSAGTAYELTNNVLLQQIAKLPAAGGAAVSTVIPVDNTIPQSTEGDEYISITFTPKHASSVLRCRFNCFVTNSGANEMTVALFCAVSTVNALAASVTSLNAGSLFRNLGIELWMPPPLGAVSTTLSIRVGPSAGTGYVNRATGGSLFGAMFPQPFSVEEYLGVNIS